MELQIIEKGQTFDLEIASKAKEQFYFGAGWDNPNGPVDLDLVCCLLSGGKLTNAHNYVYFGNRFAQGVKLSEDNQTGEGDGDDESLIIDTRELAGDIDSIVVGLVAYAGADLSSAPNPHFRVCDGSEETSPQLADVPLRDTAKPGDTALVACLLKKTSNGWTLENKSELYAMGNGSDAIKAFAQQYQ